jgi:hypothetical protein
MDGNFLGRYEKKIEEFKNLIETDLENKKVHETNMHSYMLDCIPYIEKYSNQNNAIENPKTSNSFLSTTMTKGLQRKDIYYDYLRKVEKYDGNLDDRTTKSIDTSVCKRCKSSNIVYNAIQSDVICTNCGSCYYYQVNELSYAEQMETSQIFITYAYKRDNHFNEWILQFQAREQTSIPDDVIEQLRNEFKKQKIKNLSEITHAKVRALLKKIKMNKYYEHVPYITNILNGVTPPTMSQELEDKLRQLFKEIQAPFNKWCPENRKNFLSYSYVLYKFCELLSEDNFLGCFPLLKSKEKLHQQDLIWKNICQELKWEYIPTI